jgi:hypothetical protein
VSLSSVILFKVSPFLSGLLHFFTRRALSLANSFRGLMMWAFTSDIVVDAWREGRKGKERDERKPQDDLTGSTQKKRGNEPMGAGPLLSFAPQNEDRRHSPGVLPDPPRWPDTIDTHRSARVYLQLACFRVFDIPRFLGLGLHPTRGDPEEWWRAMEGEGREWAAPGRVSERLFRAGPIVRFPGSSHAASATPGRLGETWGRARAKSMLTSP